MKKRINFICLFLVVCCVLVTGCRVSPDKTVTGDVKDENHGTLVDDGVGENEAEKDKQAVISPEQSEPDVKNEQEQMKADVEHIIASYGMTQGNDGIYGTDAESFAMAIKSGNKDKVAFYTGGKSEYYDFLEDVQISDYTLYPVSISADMDMGEDTFVRAEEMYLVEFDVSKSRSEYFPAGKQLYYIGFEMNPLTGNLLYAFVNAAEENLNDYIFVSLEEDYVDIVTGEFASLYYDKLYEGRNYADSFDFSDSYGAHLITHLMANNKNYSEPPYTLDEVNEFISNTFDANEGIDLSDMDISEWTRAGSVYDGDDEDRIYGCSWAHGAATPVSRITNVEADGTSLSCTLLLYSDYSYFAKASELVFNFDVTQDNGLRFTMVNLRTLTDNDIAILSV